MIAAAVVSHNTRELLLECVASLVEATHTIQANIVVVDNASSDGSAEAVSDAYPKITLIANDVNLGFGRACNQAIGHTTSPFVLVLNSDTRVNAEAIAAMGRCMESNPRCGAAACAIVNTAGARVPNTRNFLSPFNQAFELVGLTRRAGPTFLRRTRQPRNDVSGCDCSVDWIEGACLMLRRTALDEVGLFDERFFMYSEDEDLCFRLKQAGWSVCFCGEAAVIHYGGASSALYRSEMLREFYVSQMRFLAKHRGQGAARCYAAAMKLALGAKRISRRGEALERLAALAEARRRFARGA